jgi:uncharacterized protein (TIGR03382 family)
VEYYRCVPAFGTDPGFCNSNLDCPCPDQICDTGIHSCVMFPVDAGVDAGMDAGPVEPLDAGKTCVVDIDCGGVCGNVCSHAMTFWLCIQGSGDHDQGFCNTDLDCPCTDEFCDFMSNNHFCRSRAPDAGAGTGSDAGHFGISGTSSGGGTTGCNSGGGLAGIGVLGLLGAAVLSRRRRLARWQ